MGDQNTNGKTAIIVAIIGGICTIAASIISGYMGREKAIDKVMSQAPNVASIDELINMYNQLSNNNDILKNKISSLESQNNSLINENESLKDQLIQYESLNENYDNIDNLKSENLSLKNQNSTLISENESLKIEVSQLQNELQNMKANSDTSKHDISPETNTSSDETGEKVSIFSLDTFKGESGWYDLSYYSSKDVFTDTYGTEYLTAYVGHHSGRDINYSYNPTYLLDYKYTTFEGQIAWSKSDKNSKETAWIEFYSDNELIYITDKITVDSRPLSFSFSVEGIEKLTIVRNATNSSSSWIVYPYLNLVK